MVHLTRAEPAVRNEMKNEMYYSPTLTTTSASQTRCPYWTPVLAAHLSVRAMLMRS